MNLLFLLLVSLFATADRQDISEMPQLIDLVRNHNLYNLPTEAHETLKRLAEREEGYVPTTARNILSIYGEQYTPIFRLPEAIANDIGLPIANSVGAMQPKLTVYPNPANNVVTFTWKDDALGNVTANIIVTDMFGRIVATQTVENGGNVKVSVSSLPSGHYLCRLSDNFSLISSGKFFVQH